MRLFLYLIAMLTGTYGALIGDVRALLCAAFFTFVASSSLFGSHSGQEAERIARVLNELGRNRWALGVGLALALSASAAWFVHRDLLHPKIGYLWGSALVVVVVAAWLHDRRQIQRQRADYAQAQPANKRLLWDGYDWVVIFGLTALALALRLYRLTDFLPTVHGDEGEMGLLALLALHGPSNGDNAGALPLFATAFLDHPTLFYHLQAGAMRLFGESYEGLRILSVIFGALCAPLAYTLGRSAWGRMAGLTAGWLLTVSHLHIQYSRIALNNIQSVWFLLLFVTILFWAYAHSSQALGAAQDADHTEPLQEPLPLIWPYMLAGLAMGLSQYFYYGSRLIPVLAVPMLGYLWYTGRLHFKQLAIFVAATIVAYLPQAIFYFDHPQTFLNRTQGVSVFNAGGLAHTLGPEARWPEDIGKLFWEQLKRNTLFIVGWGDRSAFYFPDLPAFDPLTVFLIWLGLGATLVQWRRFPEFTLLAWIGFGTLLAGILTNDAPNGPRLIVVVPVLYLFAGILPQKAYHFASKYLSSPGKWSLGLLACVIAVGTFYLNFETYFVDYASRMPNMMPITMATEMARNGQHFQAYLFGAPNYFVEHGVLRFGARQTERFNVDGVEQLPDLATLAEQDKGLLVFALPHRLADLDQVTMRYPNGKSEDRYDTVGRLLYRVYRIDHEMVAAKKAEEAASTGAGENQVYAPTALISPLPAP